MCLIILVVGVVAVGHIDIASSDEGIVSFYSQNITLTTTQTDFNVDTGVLLTPSTMTYAIWNGSYPTAIPTANVSYVGTSLTISRNAFNGWFNPAYQHRVLLGINNAFIESDLHWFPVLVNISSNATIFPEALTTGHDVIFVSYEDNTTQLPHELEYYNVTGNTANASFWVNVTDVWVDDYTYFWMYYGNAAGTLYATPELTWANGYVMVFHCNETHPYNGQLFDSCTKRNFGTYEGEIVNNTGIINWVNATSAKNISEGTAGTGTNRINLSTHLQNISSAWRGSMEFWFRNHWIGANADDPVYIAASDSGDANNRIDILGGAAGANSGHMYLNIRDGNDQRNWKSTNKYQYSWNYMYYSTDTTGNRIVVMNRTDGGTDTGAYTAPFTSNNQSFFINVTGLDLFHIGQLIRAGSNTIYGNQSMDEIRISNISRNSSWMNATFHTTNSTTGFMSFARQDWGPQTIIITGESDVTNVFTIANSVWGVIGILLIIGSILAILVIMKRSGVIK